MGGKQFTEQDCMLLEEIMSNRRDIRGNHFTQTPIPDEELEALLMAASHAPSVGFSQPWQFVVVRDDAVKQEIRATYENENKKAKKIFDHRSKYADLKLEGIIEAPVNIAVFYQASDAPVLGQTSMREMGLYSVVCAVQNLWLMARAKNIGVGWVSILDPNEVKRILHAPDNCQLVAYLCVGYVTEFLERPELEVLQWEKRKQLESVVHNDRFL